MHFRKNRRRRRQLVHESTSKMVYNSSTITSSQHILDPLGTTTSHQLTRSQHNLREIQGGGGTIGHAGIYSNILNNTNNQSNMIRETYAAVEQQQGRVILPASVPPSLNTTRVVLSKFQQQHQQLQQQHQLQLEQQNQSLTNQGANELFDNYSQMAGEAEHTVDSFNFNPNIYDGDLSVGNATATVVIGKAAAFSSANSMMHHQHHHSSKQTKSTMETQGQLVLERVRYSSQIQQDQHVDFLGDERSCNSNQESHSNYMNFDSRNNSQQQISNSHRQQEFVEVNHYERESADGSGRANTSFTRVQVVSPVPSEQRGDENEVQEMSMYVAAASDHAAPTREIILKHSNNTFVINKDFD
jgi:hypothetical protein